LLNPIQLTVDKWIVSRRVLNSFSYSGPLKMVRHIYI
jgi:hypothetical protein